MSNADPSHTVGLAPGSAEHPDTRSGSPVYRSPKPSDGAEMWRMARDSKTLDLNSPYMYLLGASHFADTSLIAQIGERYAGFVWGYLRPDAPDTLFVWQVAVDPAYRGRGLARGMLTALTDRLAPRGCRYLEASVTPDNHASEALFTGFARSRGVPLDNSEVLFDADAFPPGHSHQPEVLFRIGPLPTT